MSVLQPKSYYIKLLTHIDGGGSVTDFFGALFFGGSRNASPAGKIEPPKNLSQNAPPSMCVRKTRGIFVS